MDETNITEQFYRDILTDAGRVRFDAWLRSSSQKFRGHMDDVVQDTLSGPPGFSRDGYIVYSTREQSHHQCHNVLKYIKSPDGVIRVSEWFSNMPLETMREWGIITNLTLVGHPVVGVDRWRDAKHYMVEDGLMTTLRWYGDTTIWEESAL